MKQRFLAVALSIGLIGSTFSAPARANDDIGEGHKIKHVLLVSVDGLHALDVARYVEPTPTLPLSREPHRVEDQGKCVVVIIVGGLRSHADEIDQTIRTQNGDEPIRFLAAEWRNIT